MSTAYPAPSDRPQQHTDQHAHPYGNPYAPQYAPQYYGHPQSQAPSPASSPPATVVLAFRLLLAQIVLSVIGAVATLFASVAGDGVSHYGGMTFTGSSFVALVALVVVGVLIGNGLWLFFGVKMQQGRNWARIVLAVFGGLSILGTLTSLGANSAVSIVLNLVTSALIATMIVCMFRGDAKAWFAPRS